MAPGRKDEKMELEIQALRKDMNILSESVRETNNLVRDIKILLIGNKELDTEGIVQEFEEAKGIITQLVDKVEEFTAKVKHIFDWREKYLAGKKEYRAWKTERFRWTFQNIWTVIATAFSVFMGLKQLGVI